MQSMQTGEKNYPVHHFIPPREIILDGNTKGYANIVYKHTIDNSMIIGCATIAATKQEENVANQYGIQSR